MTSDNSIERSEERATVTDDVGLWFLGLGLRVFLLHNLFQLCLIPVHHCLCINHTHSLTHSSTSNYASYKFLYTQSGNMNKMPSVLWRCWLGGRKGIRPVKKLERWGAGVVICLELGADLHMAQLMPLPPTVSCFSKIQIGFTFLVPAHPGSPGKRAVEWVYVW